MKQNTSRFRIERNLGRWEIIDPATSQEISHSATWDGAVTAAITIEGSQMTPVADARVAVRTFRETLRLGHLSKVLSERLRRQATT